VKVPSIILKKLCISLAVLSSTVLPTAHFAVKPPKTPQYTVPFQVKNTQDIEKLIQCESQGVNIARPDSNRKISWGVLQFNGTSTWQEAEKQFDFYGSPMIPGDAVHMADMMISNGELGRWTCARLTGLVK
jgi:hypothetical protein